MKLFFTSFLLFLGVLLLAQPPVNDDCSGLIDLGVAPACPDTFFSNVDATASNIGFGNSPSCFNGGVAENDVWFSFITSDTIFDYTITVTGLTDGVTDALENPQIALYRGECLFDGLAELLCESAEEGETIIELDALGLTPNVPYFIRISDYSATATPNEGTFQICVDELQPVNTIDEMGSSSCFGELYDSGGPDEDYTNDENHVFTICPQELTNCINFTLEYYHLGNDELTFYDGDDTSAPIIATVGGFGNSDGGGVCFMVQASSGCLTVEFDSDGFNSFEGFAGSWQCSALPCETSDPLVVTPGVTEQEIVDFITTPQTFVTITDIQCIDESYGTFLAGDQTNLGLEKGLLLTSGDLNWAVGPNDDGGGGNPNDMKFQPGDEDLDILSMEGGNFNASEDACVIELDVFAATNELTFEYVFASEEYPEFVNTSFNDIFAFLISGPGITGNPAIGNQLNIAALPDGTPVQINDVNNDINWEYYRSNEGGVSIQYDGLTSDFLGIKKSLTARAQVQPCSTYHLKLAIADRGDGQYDSGVFISELKGGSPDVSIKFNSGIDYLIEDCTTIPDDIVIALTNPLEDTVSYNIEIGGTAGLGTDYLLTLPSSITFLPGEDQFSFPITVLSDLLDEGTETITISLTNDFGCGVVTLATLVIELRDVLDIEVFAGRDTAFLCIDSLVALTVEGAANYFWSPVNVFDDPLSENPVATPDSSMMVYVEGTVGLCVDTDSVYLQQVNPMINIEPIGADSICEGGGVQLEALNNVANQGLSWQPAGIIDDPLATIINSLPAQTTEFIASINLSGCITSDTLEVIVDPFTFPTLTPDTVICENYSVQLATQEPGVVTTTYSWSPAESVSDPTDPEAIATPDEPTNYQLIATSASGICADTANVLVFVTPVDVEIQNSDTTYLCKGQSVDLVAETNTGIANGLVWGPTDDPALSDTLGLIVTATPEVSGKYITTFRLGDCVVFDSIFIQVDSLPTDLTISPIDTSVCEGSPVILTANEIYDPATFPNITFAWSPAIGLQSDETEPHMVISAMDTVTYRRYSISGACRDSTFVTVNAKPIPQVMIDPNIADLCVGEPLQLNATSSVPPDSIRWMPETGLSCTDCLDPVYTPGATGEVAISIEVLADECPGAASAIFTITPEPLIDTAEPPLQCPGTSVQLNFADDGVSSYSWQILDDPTVISTNATEMFAPDATTSYVLTAENDCFTLRDTITVEVFDDLQLSVSDDLEVCENIPFEISVSSNLPNGFNEEFLWEWADQSSNDPTLNLDDITETTEFILTYTFDCDVLTDTVLVTVVDPPSVTFPEDDLICFNEGNIVLNLDPQDGVMYQWSTASNPNFSTDADPSDSPTTTTTYTVELSKSNCPTVVESFTLNVIEPADVSLSLTDTIICSGEAVMIVATSTAPDGVAESFSWEANGVVVGTGSTLLLENILDDTALDLVYTYGEDCETIVRSAEIIIEDLVDIVSLTVDPGNEVGLGREITITLLTDPESLDGLTYIWQANGSIINQDAGPIMDTPLEDTKYIVSIFTPERNCEVMAMTEVKVVEPVFEIPNVFTPNNDGKNDFFNIVTNGLVTIQEFRVYNRWGKMIYNNDNPAEGWDGRDGGDPAPSEVYVYRMVLQIGDNPPEVRSGDVTLIR